jgi:hypothetical protein
MLKDRSPASWARHAAPPGGEQKADPAPTGSSAWARASPMSRSLTLPPCRCPGRCKLGSGTTARTAASSPRRFGVRPRTPLELACAKRKLYGNGSNTRTDTMRPCCQSSKGSNSGYRRRTQGMVVLKNTCQRKGTKRMRPAF